MAEVVVMLEEALATLDWAAIEGEQAAAMQMEVPGCGCCVS